MVQGEANPEAISFGGGLPAPEVFPIAEFQAACDKVLETEGAAARQSSNSEGYAPLREMIARQMDAFGRKLGIDNILITTRTQQSIDLASKMPITNAERILVEDPTFLGALQVFSVFGARYVPVPIDDDGRQTDLLPEAFRAGPRFMCLIPTSKPRRRDAFDEAPRGADRPGGPVRDPDRGGRSLQRPAFRG